MPGHFLCKRINLIKRLHLRFLPLFILTSILHLNLSSEVGGDAYR